MHHFARCSRLERPHLCASTFHCESWQCRAWCPFHGSVGLTTPHLCACLCVQRVEGCEAAFSEANHHGEHPSVLELLTNPRVLPKVTEVLDSANISCSHFHLRAGPG